MDEHWLPTFAEMSETDRLEQKWNVQKSKAENLLSIIQRPH